jgi:hypothetical protein
VKDPPVALGNVEILPRAAMALQEGPNLLIEFSRAVLRPRRAECDERKSECAEDELPQRNDLPYLFDTTPQARY